MASFFDNEVSMADQNEFRNDEKVLEAIRKSQERRKEPEGLNFEEVIRKATHSFHAERELAYGFAKVILGTVHREDGWWSRLKMERSSKSLEDEINHLHNCHRCKQAMGHAFKAFESLNCLESGNDPGFCP